MRVRRGRVGAALALAALAACATPPAAPPPAPEVSDEERALLHALGYADRHPTAEPERSGVTRFVRDAVWPGYHLFTNDVDEVYLDDLDGRRLRTWRLPYGDCQHAEALAGGRLAVVCAGEALVLLEADGRIAWRLEAPVHHDVAPRPGGGFFAPLRPAPRWHRGRLVVFDEIVAISADGRIEDRWSSFDALPALRRAFAPTWLDAPPDPQPPPAPGDGSLLRPPAPPADYFHLNSVEVLPDTPLGRRDPRFAAGKLLVSLRNVDTIGVLDWADGSLDWHWGPGVIQKQHMPTLLPDGHVLVFDNGFERGRSRVLELDPTSGAIIWQYPPEPRDDFASPWQGGSQRLPNGHTLIADSTAGRALEVDRAGRVVWEYHQPDVVDGKRRAIYRFTRIPASLARPLLGDGAGSE